MSAPRRTCTGCRHEDGIACVRKLGACPMDVPGRPYWEPRADAPAAAQEAPGGANAGRKHPHYFKDVSGLSTVDVYRVLELFGVTSPCLQHSIKKLLCAGQRGAKDQAKDVQEAIDTLVRWQEMRREDNEGGN